ncbi:MAG TPA: cyclic nucleotide-binding domain-containing protein [Anaerolineales bacterium]|nr:cyclic nucleotide-binding domain-containing protein [Anaerolineales bacterium]
MSDETIISQLKKSFLFRGLPNEALIELGRKATRRGLAKDEVLMRKGDVGDSLFMISKGWFKIVTEDARGGELVINQTGPGETIGEMALLDRAPRSATAIASSEAEVLELKQDAFYEILNQRPDLALELIRSFSSRLRFSTTYIQKAIEWSQKISAGDYSFIENTLTVSRAEGTDEDKASQLLSAFFQMVRNVKDREDQLKQQVERLILQIDEARRKQEFEEITSTDFYADLKEQAKKLRAQRAAQQDQK